MYGSDMEDVEGASRTLNDKALGLLGASTRSTFYSCHPGMAALYIAQLLLTLRKTLSRLDLFKIIYATRERIIYRLIMQYG